MRILRNLLAGLFFVSMMASCSEEDYVKPSASLEEVEIENTQSEREPSTTSAGRKNND